MQLDRTQAVNDPIVNYNDGLGSVYGLAFASGDRRLRDPTSAGRKVNAPYWHSFRTLCRGGRRPEDAAILPVWRHREHCFPNGVNRTS